MASQQNVTINHEIIKDVYRKTKLIQKNQVKTIWEITHIYTGDVVVAKTQYVGQTINQRNVLHQGKFLQTCQGSPGIPFLVWCGKDEAQKLGILIQQKLGKTLRQLKQSTKDKKFSIKTVTMIGLQLLKMVASYHQKGYINRNINLDTLQFGSGSRVDNLYFNDLIDSKSFYKKSTFQHIERKTNIKLKKMNQFSSYDTLEGIEQSRKDDIESIMLVLIHLFKGSLPWSKIFEKRNAKSSKVTGKQKMSQSKSNSPQRLNQSLTKTPYKYPQLLAQKISNYLNGSSQDWKIQKKAKLVQQIMQSYPPKLLCQGLPKQFQQIWISIKNLQFTQKPDYISYIQKLNAVLIKRGLQNDNIYDWMTSRNLSKGISKGGLSIKQYELLLSKPGQSKICKFQNEDEILKIYQKYSPFVQIDKLVSL